jgi:alpha-1,2-mannosyltransferase
MGDKVLTFYLFRITLGLVCAFAETIFYSGVNSKFGGRAGRYTLLFMLFNPGMFSAASAMLPNTYCMVCSMIALGYWFQDKHVIAVIATGFGVLIGWPYIGLMFIPLAIDTIYNRGIGLFVSVTGITASLILITCAATDYFYYQRFILPVLNHVAYNVFGGGDGSGSELYGTEPMSFYFLNSLLNGNVAFILAMMYPFLIFTTPSPRGSMTLRKLLSFVAPLYLWFTFMLLQAHKEERFMYVIYPLVCQLGALSLERLRIAVAGFLSICLYRDYIEPVAVLMTRFVFVWTFIISLSRVLSNHINFDASVAVYRHLYYHELPEGSSGSGVNICVGKEWYRFPSNFFIPQGDVNLAFLKSSFQGQLPKLYSETNGTWIITNDFNDKNQEEVSRYVQLSDCDYIIDLALTHQVEPHYENDADYEIVFEQEFLDSSLSPSPYRSFYIPSLSRAHNVYARYLLLKSKSRAAVREIASKK